MTIAYYYDGALLGHDVPPSMIDIPSQANDGAVSFGRIPVEDPTQTLDVLGHRPFYVVESACSQPRLWTGWTAQRDIGRSLEQAQFIGADPAVHDMSIVDLNAAFGFRVLYGSTVKRPEETVSERLTWLLASSFLTGLVEDTGFVSAASLVLDAADYTRGYPSAVLDDCVQRCGTNVPWTYFAFWDTVADAVGLFFGPISGATLDSTLSISNDLDDVDGVACFAPTPAARVSREPDQVYSEVIVEYANGLVFRSRDSTANRYIRRGTTTSRPHTGRASTAALQAEKFLDRHAIEMDRVTCTIHVPAASVGLVLAGQRMSVKLTHVAGYTTAQSMRVVACSPVPVDDLGLWYDIGLELVAPTPTTTPGSPCTDVTTTDTFLPLNSGTSDSRGNIMYLRPGLTYNIDPTPFFAGDWHFPVWGTTGSPDYAGDCVANTLRFAVVGPGSALFTSKKYTDGRTLAVKLYHQDGPEAILDSTQYVLTDNACTVTVPDDGFCSHWVDITDYDAPCGGKWGWVSIEWTAGEVDTAEDLGGRSGAVISSEVPTPAPDGTETDFTTANSYRDGSLHVWVDGVSVPTSEVTETDPMAGTFTLSWAPDADEVITVLYTVA